MARVLTFALALALAACGDDAPRDPSDACGFAAIQSTSTVEDRRAIGLAAAYLPDLELAARDRELAASATARRAAAWEVVGRVLRPVPLGDTRLADRLGGAGALPAWHTWYGRDDFARVFRHLFAELSPADRAARAAIDGDAGLAWNATALDDDPAWPEERYLAYLADVETELDAHGLGGIARVGYSPGALRHLVESYRREAACRGETEPPAFETGATRAGHAVATRAAVELPACAVTALAPIVAGPGGVRVEASDPGVTVYLRRGAAPTAVDHDCAGAAACELDGAGPVYAALVAVAPTTTIVTTSYVTADIVEPACLAAELPRDAVIVKADWRRVDGDTALPTFDTGPARLAQRLAGDATWTADGTATPDASSIYTVALPGGARYRLPALHIMSKELDHWMWITLWYAPDPDADFGADRPPAIAALPGPWRNYKMCVVTDFLDGAAPSWCSNPYLERGAGNAATNCIGCHQHGGTALTAESILATPAHGTSRVRNNFPADYLWAVKGGAGDELSAIVESALTAYDGE